MIILRNCSNISTIKIRHFRRNLEMPLINSELNLIKHWSENCVISSATGAKKFAKTDIKLYVPVRTLSTQDNIKLLKHLESGLKGIINWNIYQSKIIEQTQNRYLEYLIDLCFLEVNRPFV